LDYAYVLVADDGYTLSHHDPRTSNVGRDTGAPTRSLTACDRNFASA